MICGTIFWSMWLIGWLEYFVSMDLIFCERFFLKREMILGMPWTHWYQLEKPTGTKRATSLHQRGSLFGTGWSFQPVPMEAQGTGWKTGCLKARPLVLVCGNRLEDRCLRPFPTGSHSLFSSSGISVLFFWRNAISVLFFSQIGKHISSDLCCLPYIVCCVQK